MPSYRLLAGCTTVLEVFDVEDDRQAIDYARQLSVDFPWEPRTFQTRWGYFLLERRDGYLWQMLFAWVPQGQSAKCPERPERGS
ncbi:hypothetical protein [Blastococcus tunisiensis]|uniref:Uncharacterized protein n=1 Tax=Blastococcus tunisiensis TaxID=1798228 RepID=A0A1I2EI44_9ACTN|nr:hypothetical protein [Blastococcus sp. DSM 46838]SFE92652.1 hypothetical protein SAMN05216574_10773 [Blastococcus sp. DSM 46838]